MFSIQLASSLAVSIIQPASPSSPHVVQCMRIFRWHLIRIQRAWSRSEYRMTCFTYCLKFHLFSFLPSWFIQLHFPPNLLKHTVTCVMNSESDTDLWLDKLCSALVQHLMDRALYPKDLIYPLSLTWCTYGASSRITGKGSHGKGSRGWQKQTSQGWFSCWLSSLPFVDQVQADI